MASLMNGSTRAKGGARSLLVLEEQKFLLRSLNSEDIPQVKALCADCFPIDYPDSWFKYITSGKVRSFPMRRCN